MGRQSTKLLENNEENIFNNRKWQIQQKDEKERPLSRHGQEKRAADVVGRLTLVPTFEKE